LTSAPTANERLKYLFRRAGVPMTATIEIADRCNEVCVHCYQVQGQKGEMDTETLLRVVDELAEAGVLQLVISGGEPTLRHDFLDVVRRARARDLLVVVFTNGLRITPEMARELAALHVFRVEISLYSHRAEAHDGVTGVPGSFERTVRAIRLLRAEGVHVLAKTPVGSFNEAELEAWVTFVRGLGAAYEMSPDRMHLREGGVRGPEAYDRSDDAAVALLRQLGSGKAMSREAKLDARPCGVCRALHVEANGEIRPCAQLEVSVGDAAVQGGIRRSLAGEVGPQRLLRSTRWRDMHGCRDCDLMPHCERCYAEALNRAGDAFGPYDKACEMARLRYEASQGLAPTVLPGDVGDRATGPYRALGNHRFERVAHTRTAEDEARRTVHPWSQGPASGLVPVEALVRPRVHLGGNRPSKSEYLVQD
jgi:radical SAM protein with 4Fe4S-binding SPASM domain